MNLSVFELQLVMLVLSVLLMGEHSVSSPGKNSAGEEKVPRFVVMLLCRRGDVLAGAVAPCNKVMTCYLHHGYASHRLLHARRCNDAENLV